MIGETALARASRAGVLALSFVVSGCGGGSGQHDAAEVADGNVTYGQPYTLRDGGKPVNGTVVHKNAAGKVVDETQFKDGFPSGTLREWYDNGQMKSERQVEYQGGGLHPRGVARAWCENGTLQQETDYGSDGNVVGKEQTWTCTGKLLSLKTHPYGPVMSASELTSGEVVVIEEGVHPEGGGWEGEHKRFYTNGKPQIVETYSGKKFNGPYKAWNQNGELVESGAYADGQKTGLWTKLDNGTQYTTDYDQSHFADVKYVDAFMQAAGIQPAQSWAAKSPLREFKVDLEKIKYYVSQGLVDPKKKLDLSRIQEAQFQSTDWTYAYIRASRGALDLLVELGADPKAIDSSGRNRINYCVYSLSDPNACSPAEIQRLIGLGVDAAHADVNGDTALHDLVMSNVQQFGRGPSPQVQADVLKALLDAGANVDAMNRPTLIGGQGMSPLMLAVVWKQWALATAMLEHTKNPAQATASGFNLIHLVFLMPQNMQQFDLTLRPDAATFIKAAASKGVDPNAKVGEMGSMKEIAQQNGAIELAQFLTSLGQAG